MDSPQPTFAVQLLRPLARFINTQPEISDELKQRLAALDCAGDRVPALAAREFWQAAVAATGDPDLGLRVALCSDPGDFEVLEWVTSSAATWAGACEAVCRYVRVLNETAEYRVDVCGDKAHVILGSTLPLTRELADFRLAMHHLGIQRWFGDSWSELAVWMKHDQPDDLSGYRAIFPNCKLVFRAAFDGYVYDAWRLETALPTADPVRHNALRMHVDSLLKQIAPADSVVSRVSVDVIEAMHGGEHGAERTASRLGMSRRTLVRRLQEHGTSYSELLKEARYRTAMHYLHNTPHTVDDIAFLLGYAECAPFVRAFKRWSGRAPLEYRRYHMRMRASAETPRAAP
jgi:AraC-like DNA-binding protein